MHTRTSINMIQSQKPAQPCLGKSNFVRPALFRHQLKNLSFNFRHRQWKQVSWAQCNFHPHSSDHVMQGKLSIDSLLCSLQFASFIAYFSLLLLRRYTMIAIGINSYSAGFPIDLRDSSHETSSSAEFFLLKMQRRKTKINTRQIATCFNYFQFLLESFLLLVQSSARLQ